MKDFKKYFISVDKETFNQTIAIYDGLNGGSDSIQEALEGFEESKKDFDVFRVIEVSVKQVSSEFHLIGKEKIV